MYGYVFQDWITIRGAASVTSIIQNESDWMGFSSFQDIVFWVDVRAVTPNGATMTLSLQTCPTKDESLFKSLSNCDLSITVAVTPWTSSGALPKTILSSNPAVPLSTWVRWAISATGASGTWDITFRILASANRVVA